MSEAAERVPWLDEQSPHEPEVSDAQIDAIVRRVGPGPCRVLDLGCGHGRVLRPLVAAGHEVVGVDRDPEAIAACARGLAQAPGRATLVTADVRAWSLGPDEAPFDVVLCLGNTIMTFADLDDAVRLFRAAAGGLRNGGRFFVDDCPADFWPEVTTGHWIDGVTEDGRMQLVWSPSDTVFTLRLDDDVRPGDDELGEDDRRFRLWTDGLLALVAARAGLSAPCRLPGEHLLVMHPAEGPGTLPSGP